MTAVTSNQCLPDLIDEMPPGNAKDLVLQLCGHCHRFAILFVTPCKFLKVATLVILHLSLLLGDLMTYMYTDYRVIMIFLTHKLCCSLSGKLREKILVEVLKTCN